MNWDTINFGSHCSRTLPEIMFKNPDWLYWAADNPNIRQRLNRRELHRIRARSDRIRIPCRADQPMAVRYKFDLDGTLVSVELVPREGCGLDSGKILTSTAIDMSLIHWVKLRGRVNTRKFMAWTRWILLGTKSRDVDRGTCEAFFDDDSNFVLEP